MACYMCRTHMTAQWHSYTTAHQDTRHQGKVLQIGKTDCICIDLISLERCCRKPGSRASPPATSTLTALIHCCRAVEGKQRLSRGATKSQNFYRVLTKLTRLGRCCTHLPIVTLLHSAAHTIQPPSTRAARAANASPSVTKRTPWCVKSKRPGRVAPSSRRRRLVPGRSPRCPRHLP